MHSLQPTGYQIGGFVWTLYKSGVNRRIRIVLDLEPEVVDALESGEIAMQVSEIIADVRPLGMFLEYVLENILQWRLFLHFQRQ